MSNKEEPSEIMTIRIPRDIAAAIRELKKDRNLSTLGTAVRVYLEEARSEQLQEEINKLSERIEAVFGVLGNQDKLFEKKLWPVLHTAANISCKLAIKTWGPASELALKMREVLECPVLDAGIKELWERKQGKLKKLGITYLEFKKEFLKQCHEDIGKKSSPAKAKSDQEEHVK